MYEINILEDKYKIYEIRDNGSNSWVKIVPQRGGIIIGYGVDGIEKLYLDKDTFYDENANIRGGIPILFPICGKLKDGKYSIEENEYTMKNHGLARISKWQVIDEHIDKNSASIKIQFNSDEITRESYPFDFQVIFTYTLENKCLKINQQYFNKSNRDMPVYIGFHPYFKADNKNIKYNTDATKYLDENDGKIKCYNGKLSLYDMVESAIFLDSKQNNVNFVPCNDGKNIYLEYSKEFKYIVLWTVAEKNFVCVEPWMALGNSMNTKNDLSYIKAMDNLELFLNIKIF
ncbi:MAG: galactose mutarotase-like enzyme [Clostridiaceae bacterium]|jgi:galactose mutarotase-like enzyme|nr:galactose mutarotase-like enzyme [Clostridiaceae bacterium]